MPTAQSYASHTRYEALYHFLVLPLFALNLAVATGRAIFLRDFDHLWGVIVAVALFAFVASMRLHAVRLQDRIIRLEERLRLWRILSPEHAARVEELRTSQLVALRFCPDAELPALARAAIEEKLSGSEIKKRIQTWRPDNHRV